MAKKKEELHAVAPVLRVAPLGQLNIYAITEDELDSLQRGSPGSLFLNIGLALTPVSFAFLITLLSTSIPSIEGKLFFIVATVLFGLAGSLFLLLAWYFHQSVKTVVEKIKKRMPEAIPEGVTSERPPEASDVGAKLPSSGDSIPPPAPGAASQ